MMRLLLLARVVLTDCSVPARRPTLSCGMRPTRCAGWRRRARIGHVSAGMRPLVCAPAGEEARRGARNATSFTPILPSPLLPPHPHIRYLWTRVAGFGGGTGAEEDGTRAGATVCGPLAALLALPAVNASVAVALCTAARALAVDRSAGVAPLGGCSL